MLQAKLPNKPFTTKQKKEPQMGQPQRRLFFLSKT
jgi:hypothetical protein